MKLIIYYKKMIYN